MTTMEITPLNLSRKKDDFVVCKQRYFLEKGKQSIICFVEGKYDSDYYYDKFRNQLGEDFVIIPCQRKKNVLKAYDCFYENDHQRVKMGFCIIKQKVSANLNNKSFMSDYSQYADIASGLKEYLQILAS